LIYLQSFFTKPKGQLVYSVARWQPNGFSYKTLKVLVPYRKDGSAIKDLLPDEYLVEYLKALKHRYKEVKKLFKLMGNEVDYTLCCWCNPKGQKGYEKLFCHTIIIGYLAEHEFNMDVKYLDGRDKPVWDKKQFLRVFNEIFER